MASSSCKACQSLDLRALEAGKKVIHHTNLAELHACVAASTCSLCALIKKGFDESLRVEDPWADLVNRVLDDDHVFSIDDTFGDEEVEDREEVMVQANLAEKKYVEAWYGICDVEFWVIFEHQRRLTSKVQILVDQESKLSRDRIVSGRSVASKAIDDSCFELTKKWRDTCFATHEGPCLQQTEVPLPTRVIDVGPSDGSRALWLKETSGELGSYIALSHCWGKVANFVTIRQNLEEMKRKIRMDAMPKTFSDAVIICRLLGYRYLWIDSLCIIQRDYEDWIAESVCMRDYYKNAVITISADSASGDEEGFLDHERENNQNSMLTLISGEQIGFRPPLSCPMLSNRDTCVSQRAWTLQEFILSPRSLVYSAGQLVWECETRKYCESDVNSQVEGYSNKAAKRGFSNSKFGSNHSPQYKWYVMVDDYFIRDITVSSDRLPAISGLAREIQQRTSNSYHAGIWLEDVNKGLLWTMDGAGTILSSYRAPSWSWVALGCSAEGQSKPIQIYRRMRSLPGDGFEFMEHRALLLAHSIKFVDDDKFGRVSFGSITIRGNMVPWEKLEGRGQPYFQSFRSAMKSHLSSINWPEKRDQVICSFDVEEEREPEIRLRNTFVFQISSWEKSKNKQIGLALLLVHTEEVEPQIYRRIGLAEVPQSDEWEEVGWEMVDVCII